MKLKGLLLIAFSACLTAGCGAARVLEEGEHTLRKNETVVSAPIQSSELTPYIKQQPSTNFIFRGIYNLSGKGEGKFAELLRRIGTPPVVFDESLAAASASGIKDHLEYLGYYGSSVSYTPVYRGSGVRVRYDVSLGSTYRVDSIRYDLPEDSLFRAEFSSDVVSSELKKGVMLSKKLLEAEAENSSALFRQRAAFDFSSSAYRFEADTLGGSAILTYKVLAAPKRFRVDSISFEWPDNYRFRRKVLERMLTFSEGDPYNEKEVSTTYSRLSSIRSFSSVSIEMNAVSDSLVRCNVNLTPAKLQGFKVNLEASTNSSGLFGISPKVDFYHRNIFGGGEWLNIGFAGNFQTKFDGGATRSNELGASVSISFPRFLGLPMRFFRGPNIPRTDVSVAYNYQNRPEFKRNIFSASFGYSGISLGGRIKYQVNPFQVNFVNLGSMDAAFRESLDSNPFIKYAYSDHCDAGLGSTFQYSTSSDPIPTVSSTTLRLGLDASGNVLSLLGLESILGSPCSQYVRGEASLSRVWFLGRNSRSSIAARLYAGAGYAYGNSTAMPFEKQFYVGGANSLRGWQSRALGPGFSEQDSFFIIPSQTGDIKLEANLEYRLRLFWKLEGALFLDAGNVWSWNESEDPGEHPRAFGSDFYKSIAMDWGYGLRVNLSFIVLRLDMGLKFRDPSLGSGADLWRKPSQWFKSDGFSIHFGVGYPF